MRTNETQIYDGGVVCGDGTPEELGLDTTANINLLDNRKVTY